MTKQIIFLFSVVLLTGCLRGESKSLDEIFSIAKAQYTSSSRDGVPSDVTASLDSIQKELENALTHAGSSTVITSINTISDSLSSLLPQAGYTVRPGLTELRNQYIELGKSQLVSTDELKLIEARTYSTLAEELAAQKFGIK